MIEVSNEIIRLRETSLKALKGERQSLLKKDRPTITTYTMMPEATGPPHKPMDVFQNMCRYMTRDSHLKLTAANLHIHAFDCDTFTRSIYKFTTNTTDDTQNISLNSNWRDN